MKTVLWNLVATAALAVPATHAVGAELYIPLGSDDAIVVVDTERDAIVGRIDGVPAVHGLAATPDGARLVAGSYAEGPADSEPPAKPAGVSEDEHAAHHAPTAPTASAPASALSTVSVLRTKDRSVVRRIDVPGAVHHVAVSPDGRLAVVTHPSQGTISAIDLETYQVLATVATGPLPNYAAFGPDARRVYVSNAGNATVSEVDAGRWIVRRNFVVGESPEHVVLSRDGVTLYVNNVVDGSVSVLALPEGEVVRTIPLGAALHGIDLSEDGETLFVSVMGEDRLAAVNAASSKTRSATLAPAPYHLAVVRGTDKVYVSSANEPKVWVVDQGSLDVRGEIPIGGKGHQMVQTAPR
ncbi:MAG: beta-propeller fold lactonase family protein [Gammaproteobacteria bacterium]|nr:beta-propeller fold lactonase family protein [Gammaproteobacteria bacterium]NIR84336.1 beta-propeller fold lactonase family protein [Gammaproteobacteria bacterium]NIR89852.1 beta-propeller fold lactonase family protein [Gammaproteobacteria bacterium]NIU05719.1 beta-propeller fold lactonase family protein [Gammaproteobacteria bacterium]NIV52479.1 beta-propeller fold lactonase family protein [Gammaproteobacteria bacterium]